MSSASHKMPALQGTASDRLDFLSGFSFGIVMKKFFVYLLSLGHLSVDLAPGALPAVLPFLVLHNGLSYTEVAGLMFASSCLSSFVQPIFGFWADKSTKNWFLSLGILTSGIGLGLSGLATNYWLIFLAVTVMGLGSSIFHPVAAQLVNRTSERKATGMGIFSVGGNIGFGIGPLVAAAALTAWGTSGTVLFAVWGVATAALLLWAVPKMLKNLPSVAIKKHSNAKDAAHAEAEGENDWSGFARLSLVILFRSVAATSILSFIPLFCIHKFGISEAFSSTLLTFLSLCGAFMTLAGGWLTDRFGLLRACKLGYLLMAPAFALIYFAPSVWWIFPLLAVVSFTLNGTYAAFVVLGQSYLAKNVGFASGVTMGLSTSLGGIFTPILGIVADTYGIESVMVAMIVIGALCALSSFLLTEPEGRRTQEAAA
jgi:FSR family fosmidomycin resistance protein-like MFS transporter